MMRPVAGIPLKNTLRNCGRMWRQSPLDMTEDERLHLWDVAFPVAWQWERFRDIYLLLHVELPTRNFLTEKGKVPSARIGKPPNHPQSV